MIILINDLGTLGYQIMYDRLGDHLSDLSLARDTNVHASSACTTIYLFNLVSAHPLSGDCDRGGI